MMPAINKDQTAAVEKCFADIDFADASMKIVQMQNQESKRGAAAGEGPGAEGLSQGTTMKTVMADMRHLDKPKAKGVSGKSKFTVNSQLVEKSPVAATLIIKM